MDDKYVKVFASPEHHKGEQRTQLREALSRELSRSKGKWTARALNARQELAKLDQGEV